MIANLIVLAVLILLGWPWPLPWRGGREGKHGADKR